MRIKVAETKSITNFKNIINEIEQHDIVKSILILSCEANNYTPENIDNILKEVKKPIFGGIFPQIITEKNKITEGSLVIGINNKPNILTVPVPDNTDSREEKMMKFSEQIEETKTMFIFTDGFTKGISDFIDDVFNVFGLETNYIGGGAGSLEKLVSSPCLFSNQGLLQKSAMLIAFNMKSSVGVKHGWVSISQPVQITESEANVIHSIDWKPAYEVYKDIVEKHSGKKFTDDNFFDIAKAYPFGLTKLNNEMVVRDPIMATKNNDVICVGEVPQDALVYILNGNKNSLINAAKKASQEAEKSFTGNQKQKSLFLIDCISRVLFLGDDFQKELMTMYKDDYPLFGVLSIGEIANTGKSFLEFYNKTTVTAFIED